ncbi:hypothetical protein Hden_3547 [Hyphomicrobium denitrificans ATCC 51888]|uniref:Uncharacterized protein n=1 Tax=Hyphomicrobium denitrificans (strain ATCC 51888 / DSM 1869 / NCIMB 11706 / TK 0415) TaxID=582899 RepID=D8JYD4_HYPDA|nr:hypothetical protein [Hyphomicrobium denitrificans]ADJ25338.1 hypothetical protein Hden_3547 [Hyphomicrobium denitrificans ATCC 51888]
MALRPPLPWLLATLLAALLAMYLATSGLQKAQAATSAAAFAILLVIAGLRSNSPLWRRGATRSMATPRQALWLTTLLIMLAYFWCALAFYAVYLGTSLRWQHGWEYGSAMLLVAVGHAIYLWHLDDPNASVSTPKAIGRAVALAALQAVAIACGLLWLIQSGKLSSLKGDWAANQLFLAGGFTVMCLSVIIVKTHSALSERLAR